MNAPLRRGSCRAGLGLLLVRQNLAQVVMHDVHAERLSDEARSVRQIVRSGLGLPRRDDDRDVRIARATMRARAKPSCTPGICTSVNSSTMHAWCSSSTSNALSPDEAAKVVNPASSRMSTAAMRTMPSSSTTRAQGAAFEETWVISLNAAFHGKVRVERRQVQPPVMSWTPEIVSVPTRSSSPAHRRST